MLEILSTPGHLVSVAARGFARLSEARLKPLGFGVGHLPVLVALDEGRAKTQRELADFARIEQPSMAQMLARMERDGLIEREQSQTDKRSSHITLTRKARKRMPIASAAVIQGNRDALSGFTEDEVVQLIGLLKKLIVNVNNLTNGDESPGRTLNEQTAAIDG